MDVLVLHSFRIMTFRSFVTSLRRAMAPLNHDDWTALQVAFPSNLTIAKIALITCSVAVGAQGALMTIQQAMMKNEMLKNEMKHEAMMKSEMLKSEMKHEAMIKHETMKITEKLDSINELLQQLVKEPAPKPKR